MDRSPRQTHHLSFIAEFSSDIRHVSGAANVVADALSRPSDVLSAANTVFEPATDEVVSGPAIISAISVPTDAANASSLAAAQSRFPDEISNYFCLRDCVCSATPVSYTHLTLPTILLV